MAKRSWVIPGFCFSGISVGIKQEKTLDLALIRSEVPARVVGSFTTSLVQAAPVQVSKKNIRSGLCSAVIINSGNANACTGKRGLRDAKKMVSETARRLRIPQRQVLVCSTGKIGIPLPMDRILRKIPQAVKRLSPNNLVKCARAILTTDDSVKIARAEGEIFGRSYRVLGFAKGAGMIEPRMRVAAAGHATMLAFILTDARISRRVLMATFKDSVDQTFNRISVDGDTSTNDTALVLANGLAGNRLFTLQSRAGREFAENLRGVMDSLARQMVIDGEGATKCVQIVIRGARHEADAKRMAYAVANSLLVKTSFYGQDPNWGRILAAAGRSGATLDPDRTDIFYDEICVARRGVSTGPLRDREARRIMKKKAFSVRFDCRSGPGAFRVYTSDLTLDYVKLNSCYRT